MKTSYLTTVTVASVIGFACGCGSTAPSPPASSPEPDQVRVAYGTQDRSHVTGSVSSLTSEDLKHQRVGRAEELLLDRVSGVMVDRRPDGSFAIRIRGTRSMIGNNEPLVVIDGIPMFAANASLALNGLPPQNIARIDVLKDAGSTAAYGSRGANGVILITTKGTRNQ